MLKIQDGPEMVKAKKKQFGASLGAMLEKRKLQRKTSDSDSELSDDGMYFSMLGKNSNFLFGFFKSEKYIDLILHFKVFSFNGNITWG